MDLAEDQTRVAVVHASRLLREGMRDLLSRQQGLRITEAFAGGAEIRARPPREGCILLYDLGTARADGPALVMELARGEPRLPILFFNVGDDDSAIVECVRAGGAGCVLQDASVEELVTAIRAIASGAPAHSPRVITTLFSYVAQLRAGEDPPVPALTPREQQILTLVAEGLSNKEIAGRLVLQPQTVKNYVHLILQKLDLHSRLELIRRLRRGAR